MFHSPVYPANIDAALALTDEMIAARKRQPGFVSLQGAVNRATGALTTITTWETEDAAKLAVHELLGDTLDRIEALDVQVNSVDTYEVVWSV